MRLWADIETTGLNEQKDLVLEVALVLTEDNLEIIDTYSDVIYYPEEVVMPRLNDWCLKTHSESGLLDAVFKSQATGDFVEDQMIDFVKRHNLEKPVLHGSSIHFDKKFFDLHFPAFAKLLHYRLMDVSSVKEYLRPFGVIHIDEKAYGKPSHRAIMDINGSIRELKYYQGFVRIP